MSLDSHIRELHQKHRRLEQQIEEAMRHPDWSDIEVAKLKRLKLQLKDEIERLSAPTEH